MHATTVGLVPTYSHAESTPLPPAWNHSSVAVVSLTDGVWCMTSPSEQYGRQTPLAKVSSTHGVGDFVGTALTAVTDNMTAVHTHTISLTVCRGMAEARSTKERGDGRDDGDGRDVTGQACGDEQPLRARSHFIWKRVLTVPIPAVDQFILFLFRWRGAVPAVTSQTPSLESTMADRMRSPLSPRPQEDVTRRPSMEAKATASRLQDAMKTWKGPVQFMEELPCR